MGGASDEFFGNMKEFEGCIVWVFGCWVFLCWVWRWRLSFGVYVAGALRRIWTGLSAIFGDFGRPCEAFGEWMVCICCGVCHWSVGFGMCRSRLSCI